MEPHLHISDCLSSILHMKMIQCCDLCASKLPSEQKKTCCYGDKSYHREYCLTFEKSRATLCPKWQGPPDLSPWSGARGHLWLWGHWGEGVRGGVRERGDQWFIHCYVTLTGANTCPSRSPVLWGVLSLSSVGAQFGACRNDYYCSCHTHAIRGSIAYIQHHIPSF